MTGLVTGLELVVIVALGVALWAVVVAGVGVATLTRRWRRPIVLHQGDRVPLRWRWSPELAALLHRRLLTALGRVRAARPGGWPPAPSGSGPGRVLSAWRARRAARDPANRPAWVEPLAELEQLAAGVDRELVEAARQPRGLRQALLGDLAGQVRTVEHVATRMVATFRAWNESVEQPAALEAPAGGSSAVGVHHAGARIDAELDALDSALAQLRHQA